jgi:asparagine synthase (glutamine-hydrolysing)
MCGIVASITLSNGLKTLQTSTNANGRANVHKHGSTTYTNDNSHGCMNCDDSKNTDANCQALAEKLHAGLDKIKHRGPDGDGVWISSHGSVGLGHCRLSINDLSPSGAQPLHSDCGEIHAVVNGEIYDFDRLRQQCVSEHGYEFRGGSDSELVIALYKIYGAPGFFEHLRGEFAFILCDERKGCERVIAARDRFGIKPLMYTKVGGKVLMSSEAKGMVPLGWEPEWDVRAIMDCGWMADDRSVFKNVRKLMPGHWIDLTKERGFEIKQYWNADYEDKASQFEIRILNIYAKKM